MRVVVVLALAALAALIVALVSGSTLAAILVVMLALAGIVLLVRDWRAEPDAAEQASDSLGTIAELPANSVDVAVTALNMHHGNAERNVPYLKEIFTVLKPGAQVAVIDHQGKMGQDNAKMHRMMDSDAKKWLQEAGFEIAKESNILRQNADDHTLPIDDPRLARSTDQFMFIARKPAK